MSRLTRHILFALSVLLLAAGASAEGFDVGILKAPAKAPVISSFTATPSAVPYGSSTTLAWTVTGAATLSIDQGIGTVTGSSNTVVSNVTAGATYTLTATSAKGKTATAQVSVTVTGPYLMSDDANTVCHWWTDGVTSRDTKSCAWTNQGNPTFNAASGSVPPSYGPPTASDYIKLGTGNDVLDFTGNFTVCIAFTPPSGSGQQGLIHNATYQVQGWRLFNNGTISVVLENDSSGAYPRATATATLTAAVNVACGGRTGTSIVSKANLGTMAQTNGVTIVAGTSVTALLGSGGSTVQGGKIIEMWVSTTTPTDALFISVMNQVKSRAGITAW